MSYESKVDWQYDDIPTETDANRWEQGIFDAYYQSEGPFLLDESETDYTYSGTNLTVVNEKISSVLHRKTTYTYTLDNLTSANVKIYDSDGTSIIKEYSDTFTYVDGNLTKVEREVIT